MAVLYTQHSQAEEITDQQRFALFTDCLPVSIRAILEIDNSDTNLTEERISDLAEGRLRGARIFDSDASEWSFVVVAVNILGNVFSTEVSFLKPLKDPFDKFGLGQTWTSGSFGQHQGDSEFVLSYLSKGIDQFILEYLRVNEEACEGK